MAVLRTARRVVETCIEALAVVAAAVIAGMMLTITYDVFARWAFAAPTDWAYPLNAWAVLASTMLAVPYLYMRQQHIAMDLVHRAMPRGLRRFADAVTALTAGLLGIAIAGTSLKSLIVSAESGLTGSGTFNIPNCVPDAVMLVTGVLLVLVAVLFPPEGSAADRAGQSAIVPGERGGPDSERVQEEEPA